MARVAPYPGTQSVRRAIVLLKLFTDEHPAWGVTEVARHARLKKSTVHRLLVSLHREGLLSHDSARDTYSLGPELIVLGGRAMRSNDLHSISRDELERLADATGETASVELLAGKDVVIISEILSGHLLSSGQTLGTRWPAFATSTGLAILAYRPEEEVDAVLKGPLPKITPRTVTSVQELRAQIADVRTRGYAVAEEALELGYMALGAPLRGQKGEALAAISVGGPAIRFSRERIPQIGEMLRRSASRISERLGYEVGARNSGLGTRARN